GRGLAIDIVAGQIPTDNSAAAIPLEPRGRRSRNGRALMPDVVSVTMLWRILLFLHFVIAVSLLAAITMQAVGVLMPVRQAAGNAIDRFRPVPPAAFAL